MRGEGEEQSFLSMHEGGKVQQCTKGGGTEELHSCPCVVFQSVDPSHPLLPLTASVPFHTPTRTHPTHTFSGRTAMPFPGKYEPPRRAQALMAAVDCCTASSGTARGIAVSPPASSSTSERINVGERVNTSRGNRRLTTRFTPGEAAYLTITSAQWPYLAASHLSNPHLAGPHLAGSHLAGSRQVKPHT